MIALGNVLASAARAADTLIPFSSYSHAAAHKLPANACDCHMHIYDSRFAPAPQAKLRPPPATVDMYRVLQRHLGTQRTVVVTPSTYGTDNGCTLDALATLGKQARGIAVADTSITDAELERLDHAGIRGLRFNLAVGAVTTPDMIEPLARRIAPLGWHVQINMPVGELEQHAAMLGRLPVPIVFDHLARIPLPAGEAHPAFAFIRGLMQEQRAWVKLSGAYIASKTGAPQYCDVGPLVQASIHAAPEQLVWGSDWPHPTETHKPDDVALLDLLSDWTANDDRVRDCILVGNPAHLYRF
ncbi:amidohydrolase family protein [Noviherbaspirillum sp. 17J57-3]|uniref:Amidohydrolase family protein n=2 Tax=Noviherbaspirillum galbum TaxID=2709383 RepID=A0A6B3SZ70_9BURK|nr:amidohydrolase family protein [Noviherbaspirillum galbum]